MKQNNKLDTTKSFCSRPRWHAFQYKVIKAVWFWQHAFSVYIKLPLRIFLKIWYILETQSFSYFCNFQNDVLLKLLRCNRVCFTLALKANRVRKTISKLHGCPELSWKTNLSYCVFSKLPTLVWQKKKWRSSCTYIELLLVSITAMAFQKLV